MAAPTDFTNQPQNNAPFLSQSPQYSANSTVYPTDLTAPGQWQNYRDYARTATQGINNMPFVFGGNETRYYDLGRENPQGGALMTPDQRFNLLYPNGRGYTYNPSTSPLQQLLGLVGNVDPAQAASLIQSSGAAGGGGTGFRG